MKAMVLLKQIQNTWNEEILCSTCLDQLSRYVDLELDGQPAEAFMPQFKQHIGQCKVCHEEYELLRDLAMMDRTGHLPSLEALQQQLPN